MILKNGKWCIYSGDVNQDGAINITDKTIAGTAAVNFVTGYSASDINGDNIVDLQDLKVADNNSAVNITVKSPLNP